MMHPIHRLLIPLVAVALLVPVAGAASQDDAKRTVLVTGANRGIGLEFARQYRAAGWTVIGTARKPDKADDLRATGAEVVQLDVADAESVSKMATALKGRPIHLLINNAGISGRGGAVAELDFDRIERVFAVNTLGPMRVTKALLPNLKAAGDPTVVSISSGLGSIENNTGGGWYGYRESKAALNMFMRTLAAEMRDDGFKCIAMSPGWVRTDMGGAQATLSPEESITGMRRVIDRLTAEDSGGFFNHDGEKLPW